MKSLFMLMFLALTLSNCGRDYAEFHDVGAYEVHDELNATGSVTFTYEAAYDYRTIAVGKQQSDRCRAIASDYTDRKGVSLDSSSLKIRYAGPQKNCLHRNVFRDCENYEYIYQFSCRFQAGS